MTNMRGLKGDMMPDTTRRDFLRTAGTYGAASGVGLVGGFGLGHPEVVAAQATHPFGYPEGGLDVEKTVRATPSPSQEVRPFEHPYYWAGFVLVGDPN